MRGPFLLAPLSPLSPSTLLSAFGPNVGAIRRDFARTWRRCLAPRALPLARLLIPCLLSRLWPSPLCEPYFVGPDLSSHAAPAYGACRCLRVYYRQAASDTTAARTARNCSRRHSHCGRSIICLAQALWRRRGRRRWASSRGPSSPRGHPPTALLPFCAPRCAPRSLLPARVLPPTRACPVGRALCCATAVQRAGRVSRFSQFPRRFPRRFLQIAPR